MKCPKCKEEISDEVKFCTKCGANIKKEKEKQIKKEQEDRKKLEEIQQEEKIKEAEKEEAIRKAKEDITVFKE